MSVLVAERIKLLSTRAPWWTSAAAVVVVVGLTVLIAAFADSVAAADGVEGGVEGLPAAPGPILAQVVPVGLVIVLVMAALAVTTEYRFGTIRATFQSTNADVNVIKEPVLVPMNRPVADAGAI